MILPIVKYGNPILNRVANPVVSFDEELAVSARGIDNEELVIEGEDLLSRILIHEIDHLNGVLFIDHLSVIKRDIIKRKIRKKVRNGEW